MVPVQFPVALVMLADQIHAERPHKLRAEAAPFREAPGDLRRVHPLDRGEVFKLSPVVAHRQCEHRKEHQDRLQKPVAAPLGELVDEFLERHGSGDVLRVAYCAK